MVATFSSEFGGDEAGETGRSDDSAVVGAALVAPGEPVIELLGKGARRPPLKDSLDEELPLFLEPGRSGEEILGE